MTKELGFPEPLVDNFPFALLTSAAPWNNDYPVGLPFYIDVTSQRLQSEPCYSRKSLFKGEEDNGTNFTTLGLKCSHCTALLEFVTKIRGQADNFDFWIPRRLACGFFFPARRTARRLGRRHKRVLGNPNRTKYTAREKE